MEDGLKAPDIPDNEYRRLKTLRSLNLLDTEPEERFDRLTRLARRLFDVPIALVSLVDEDRQWFKSCVGLELRESPRRVSFCGHAILGDGTFIICDTLDDERFFDNPLVTGHPEIRFYAGCPLRALDGAKVGTLCVIDTQPRTFDADDVRALEDLAAIAEQELHAVQLAMLDDLTGIPNRRAFMMLATQSLRICVRQRLEAVLVLIDLDDFKRINDTFGHAEGDYALTTFVRHLESELRQSDVFARLAGDEFVVLLINATPMDARAMVARLQRALAAANLERERGYSLSFSHGITSCSPDDACTIEALLDAGDAQMYASKRAKQQHSVR